MADFTKFRTSLGGFNRRDVVSFIESQSKAHQTELLKLNRQLDALRKDNELLKQQLDAAMAGKPLPVAPPQPVICSSEEELEAYRRAEATERLAFERAEKVRSQMSALCDKAAGEYSECFEKVQSAQSEVESTVKKLQEAMQALKDSVRVTKDSFDSVNLTK